MHSLLPTELSHFRLPSQATPSRKGYIYTRKFLLQPRPTPLMFHVFWFVVFRGNKNQQKSAAKNTAIHGTTVWCPGIFLMKGSFMFSFFFPNNTSISTRSKFGCLKKFAKILYHPYRAKEGVYPPLFNKGWGMWILPFGPPELLKPPCPLQPPNHLRRGALPVRHRPGRAAVPGPRGGGC